MPDLAFLPGQTTPAGGDSLGRPPPRFIVPSRAKTSGDAMGDAWRRVETGGSTGDPTLKEGSELESSAVSSASWKGEG